MSERIWLNDNWKFTEAFSEELLVDSFDDSTMKEVRIPHTCKEVPLHYFDEHEYQMVSGYKRGLMVLEEWKGKSLILTFEGIGHSSEVYLNGEKIGEHHCGYTAFSIDVTNKVVYGSKNILVVKVDSNESQNIPPFGFVVDYMTFGGIYRDVYLDVKPMIHIEDVFVRSFVEDIQGDKGRASLKVDITLSEIMDAKCVVLVGDKAIGSSSINGNALRMHREVGEVTLWDTDNPKLYDVTVRIVKDNEIIDEKLVRFGFRKAIFKKDGFYLNDKKFKLRGLNRHQSYPYVGYAMPKSMQVQDADLLKKELGVNTVRTSHYPQSHYFIDRCDEIGLLVFTEIPGWQHIGNNEWKQQAIENTKDMVKQYRNHTSIILWGVRINESVDDDEFYTVTNNVAHELDDSRQTGGVRCYKKGSLLEDVYTYNDFLHDGNKKGCDMKKDVTSDMEKGYLVTEYGGHMFPTKAFDGEEHRISHALRHATVLNEVAKQEDIAGSYGWCMFDYNTHKDFGSGDRICYHGVMDMFRNPKLAASVYASQSDTDPVLAFSSSMDIGEHPGCNRGETYIFTNADSVKMYKGNTFLKEYTKEDSSYRYMNHGPIEVNDYIGDAIKENESFDATTERLIKDILNETAKVGLYGLSPKIWAKAARLMAFHGLKMDDAVQLYNKYVGDWGGAATSYRLEAYKNGELVKELQIAAMKKVMLDVKPSHTKLKEEYSYDVAEVRIKATDEHGNLLYFFNDPVVLETEGDIELIGPSIISLQGGMSGTYVKTTGKAGTGKLIIRSSQAEPVTIEFEIEKGE